MDELGEEIALGVVVELLGLEQLGHGREDLGCLLHGDQLAPVEPQPRLLEGLVQVHSYRRAIALESK